jgi:gamma-glutamyltranspeptidase
VGDKRCAFTSPHFLATEAGMRVLERGGNAVDAMISAAAMIAVAYPHMNGLGGDSFWLLHQPESYPWAIDACGCAASAASPDWYHKRGLHQVPSRGPSAALTMAGTVAGWQLARDSWAARNPNETLIPLEELLAPAVDKANRGITVTDSLAAASAKVSTELRGSAGYQQVFTRSGAQLEAGEFFLNPGLGALLYELGVKGLEEFYRGTVGVRLAKALENSGAPIAGADFLAYQAKIVTPLVANIRHGQVFNLPAPTQGFASLLLLASYDRLARDDWDEGDAIHAIIECTKHAFDLREKWIADPDQVPINLQNELSDKAISAVAAKVDLDKVASWPHFAAGGDTVWMSARDEKGTMVSFIQSLYWEFGSGVVVPEYGLVWNNRGSSFTLAPGIRQVGPGRKPFHTLNPALFLHNDGSRIAFGTMGGEGQPQTQAAMMMRHLYLGNSLEQSVASPRWLLGRTWGDSDHGLKIEEDLNPSVVLDLRNRGHDVTVVPALNENMGHAGMVKDDVTFGLAAAADPRSDGLALTAG